MMEKVLLTHSFLLRFDPKQFKLGQAYAPLGTLYAASMLRSAGIGFEFYDPMFAHSPDDIVPILESKKPDLLVIYDDGFNYLSKMCLDSMRKAAFRMIHAAKGRGVATILCSVDANDHADIYLDEGVDFCILGEGEHTLVQLVGRLIGKTSVDFKEIPGITWNSETGRQVSPARPVMNNLDELPFPAWDLVDMDLYRCTWKKTTGHFTLNMVTTRGCPYGCIWCAKPVYGNHYSVRSPASVVAELNLLKKDYNPDSIWFADDIFGLKPGWIDEYSRLVRENNLVIPYSIQSRVDLLLENRQVQPLADSGCRKIWLGIESGSQRILDAMHKGTTTNQARKVSTRLKEAGIEQAFFLQLGFPGEERADIDQTITLVTDLMPDDIGISVTYPLPGTPFYEAVKSQMKSKTSWKDSDDIDLLFTGTFSRTFYRYLHRYIHKYFRFRQATSYLAEMLKGKRNLNRATIRRILLLPYYFIFSVYYRILFRQAEHEGKSSL